MKNIKAKYSVLASLFLIAASITAAAGFCQDRPGEINPDTAQIQVAAMVVEIPTETLLGQDALTLTEEPRYFSILQLINIIKDRPEDFITSQVRLAVRNGGSSFTETDERESMPVKKTVTARGVDPYVITEYKDVKTAVSFEIKRNVLLPEENRLSIDFVYHQVKSGIGPVKEEEIFYTSAHTWSESLMLMIDKPTVASISQNMEMTAFLIIYAGIL